MPNPTPIVGLIESLDTSGHQPLSDLLAMSEAGAPPLAGEMSVRVQGVPELARLDLSRPNARFDAAILTELGQSNWPVYMDVNEDAIPKITNFAVPHVARVRRLMPLPSGDFEVALQSSTARHILRSGSPRFAESVERLAKAAADKVYVIVTEAERIGEISHVHRPAPDISRFPGGCQAEPLPKVMKREKQIIANVVTVEKGHADAQKLFLAMHALTCDTRQITRTCIPFAYPRDGCQARAHHMCELLKKVHKVTAAKIWLYASRTTASGCLSPKTPNNPGCGVDWEYHVAPLVRIRTPNGQDWRVIDPSLFKSDEPVPTIAQWKGRQRDKRAKFVVTEAALFDRAPHSIPEDHWDPEFICAPSTLAKYRCDLIKQIRDFGLPPYC